MKHRSAGDNFLLLDEVHSVEETLLQAGVTAFCGVDEAGRGPLAGPVVAAAVMYRDCEALRQACDSKIIPAAEREARYELICAELAYAVGVASVEEIDQINILQASLLAMHRAVKQFDGASLAMVLVDGNYPLPGVFMSRAIVDGDARVAVIGAASIVAKVRRDRLMLEYDQQFPEYGFAHNMGYPTFEHRDVLKRIGPCPIHRRTFRGVREFFQTDAEPHSR